MQEDVKTFLREPTAKYSKQQTDELAPLQEQKQTLKNEIEYLKKSSIRLKRKKQQNL